MHGVIAAELAAMGFTADHDILDGEIGVARLLGLENGDPEKMLDGLGIWDLATRGSTIRLHACCGAAHWSMDALQHILRDRPVDAGRDRGDRRRDPRVPHRHGAVSTRRRPASRRSTASSTTSPRSRSTAAPASTSTPTTRVQRPDGAGADEAGDAPIPVNGPLQSRVVLTLTNGEQLEATATRAHGNPADPLTDEEIVGKFHECAAQSATEAQRDRMIDLCGRLESLGNVRELADAIAAVSLMVASDKEEVAHDL